MPMELCYSFNGGDLHREDVKSCCLDGETMRRWRKIILLQFTMSLTIITCACKKQVCTSKPKAMLDKNVCLSFTQQVKAECFSSNAWQCAWTPSHPVKVSLRPSLPWSRCFKDSWFMDQNYFKEDLDPLGKKDVVSRNPHVNNVN